MPKTVRRSTRQHSTRQGAKSTRNAPAAKSRGGSTHAARNIRKRSSTPKTSLPRWSWNKLSSERKLDILGIILALVGLLSLLSLISTEQSSVTGLWIDFLLRLAGWGSFILPIALVILGLWLVFRNIEKLPSLSPERLIGIISVYFNVLTWMHFIKGGGWATAAAKQGGGYIGAFFERLLTGSMGSSATLVILVAWLVISLLLSFDLSLVDLGHMMNPMLSKLRKIKEEQINQVSPGNSPAARSTNIEPQGQTAGLPSTFHPLSPMQGRSPALSPQTGSRAVQPAPPADQAQPGEINPGREAGLPESAPSAAETVSWLLPDINLILDMPQHPAQQTGRDEDRARLIEETLGSFGAPSHVVEVHRGPTVTQFGVEPDFIESRTGRMRVRVSKIVSLADDLALALAAPRIRIQAPVPGRNYVGIEVPNQEISRVSLREVVESEQFQKVNSQLRFAVGKDVAGKPTAIDLTAMPHLLIAGTTGSGKSVCVNSILCCLLMNNTPNDLRLVLVDPKRVELTGYNGIPHLLAPVVVDAERVVGALQWMLREMDMRYHKFSENGVRNISEFNEHFHDQHLPYLVVVIDELADLMMLAPDETERSITRLAQLARATGIHLIIATQRPSVDVVTGLIKANFPARIAFTVASGVDSRVILDQPGAERLLGRGDMLYQAPDASGPVRLQGAFVSDHEINRLVDFWQEAAREVSAASAPSGAPVDAVPGGVPLRQAPLWDQKAAHDSDPLFAEAVDLVRREGRASITMLQRKLRVGYTRAARLIDAMEDQGIISPMVPNSQVREILDYGQTAPPSDS